MKWLSYLFCVLCLTFTLTGCGGDADSGADSKKTGSASSADDSSDDKDDSSEEEKKES